MEGCTSLDYPSWGFTPPAAPRESETLTSAQLAERHADAAAALRLEGAAAERASIDEWFRMAEDLAAKLHPELGLEHVPGRSWHGLRRAFLDAAAEEGISPQGMQEHGGWSDIQVPQQIYRDKVRKKARNEARDVRAKNRGEEAE